MKKSNFKYFHKENFVDKTLQDSLLRDIEIFDQSNEIIIDKDNNVTTNESRKGHIRNWSLDDEAIDKVLMPAIKEFKDIMKPLMYDVGMVLPQLRGVQNFVNPESLQWHKDFLPEPVDPLKRWINFLVLGSTDMKNKFMVSPSAEGLGIWNIGLDLVLQPGLLVAHNHYLGHQYTKVNDAEINIFSLLWYDMG